MLCLLLTENTRPAGTAECWLRPTSDWSQLPPKVAPLTLEALQGAPEGPAAANGLRCSLLLGAVRAVQQSLAGFGHVSSAAELFQPAAAALAALLADGSLPQVCRRCLSGRPAGVLGVAGVGARHVAGCALHIQL